MLRDPKVFQGLIDVIVEDIRSRCARVDVIVGLDSRGFLFGPMVAQALNVAFVPVRKKGKLPGETVSVSYTLEYGTVCFIHLVNNVFDKSKTHYRCNDVLR